MTANWLLRPRLWFGWMVPVSVTACSCSSTPTQVSIGLGERTYRSITAIRIADTATVLSTAFYGRWSDCRLVDSRLTPTLFRWTSSDSSVLRINADGVAHAMREGRALIWATADEVTSRSLAVVVHRAIARFAHSPSPLELVRGDSLRSTVWPVDSTGASVGAVPFVITSFDARLVVRDSVSLTGEHVPLLLGRSPGAFAISLSGAPRSFQAVTLPVLVR